MSFAKKIKLRLHKRKLQKEMGKNSGINRKSISFNNASKIGILFNASDVKQEKLVMQYVDRLRSKHKKQVSILAFFDDKEEKKAALSKNYSLKDLNWLFIPNNEDVRSFIDKPFDIAINFFENPHIHGDYIMALSKSGFRVGRNSNNTESYELMINEKKKDLAHFIGLLDTYLKTFNEEPNDPQPA